MRLMSLRLLGDVIVREAGLNGQISRRKALLLSRHRQCHLQWARKHRTRTEEIWKKVVWSDKSKFNLFHSDGRTYIQRCPSEDFHEDCLQGTVKHGGGSVMIWGCITGDEKGMLVQVRGMMEKFEYAEILENAMLQSAWAAHGLDYVLCMIMPYITLLE